MNAKEINGEVCRFHRQQLPTVKSCDRKIDTNDYVATFGEEAVASKRFYNVGAGRFFHPVWTNVDFSHPAYDKLKPQSERPAFIEHDLSSCADLPLESRKAELFYTSHTIEHIRDDAVAKLLSECCRALTDRGLLRIVCPDIDLAYRAYLSDDLRYFETFTQAGLRQGVLAMPGQIKHGAVKSPAQGLLAHFARQASRRTDIDGEPLAAVIDRVFRERSFPDACDFFTSMCSDDVHRQSPGDHINWFNYEKLHAMLRRAGFNNVWRSGYAQSSYAVLRNRRYFDRTRPCFSLYVEATK